MKKQLLTFVAILISMAASAQCIRYKDSIFVAYTLTNPIFGQNIDVNGLPKVLTMDVYEPAGDTLKGRPLIIWAFGGSFTYGDRKSPDIVQLCNAFTKKGYVCASIDYRLGIEGTATNMITEKTAIEAVLRGTHDGKAAVRFFKKNAATYNIDTNNIIFGGVSAGGFVALHNSFLNTEAEFYKYYSSVDLSKFGGIEGTSGNPGYSSHVKAVINLCGALGQREWMIDRPEVKVYSMHGDADNTVPYSRDSIIVFGTYVTVVDGSHSLDTFAEMHPEYNLSAELYTWKGADHVPFVTDSKYMDTTIRFVNTYLYSNIIDTIDLCRVSTPNSVRNNKNSLIAKIYPNPSQGGILNIDTKTAKGQVLILDAQGKKIYESVLNSQHSEINTQAWAAGMYFIKINSGKDSNVEKVQILK